MKKTHIIIVLLLSVIWSCDKDLLDRDPVSEVAPENFFIKASDLELYTNNFYRMFPEEGIYNGDRAADNIIETTLSEEMRGARIVPTTKKNEGWSWEYLRDINYFLENYERCEDEAAKKHFGGVARFFRAWFYFDKLRRFGDVPWYEQTIDPTDEEALQKPRDPRGSVTDKIIEDLDFAIENLDDNTQAFRITKWTALALKSRVGLYEGTYMKYRGMDGYEKYLTASYQASEQLMNDSPYKIYSTGNTKEDYMVFFASHDAITDEMILARQFLTSQAVDHKANYYMTTSSYGRPGMPKDLVNSYLNADGSRFTDNPDHNSMSFTEEMTNRDPRLSQTVRAPGYTRMGENITLPPNMGATVTGYQPIKFVNEPQYDTYDESITDLPLFRYAEVLLNYAEAKAELGILTQADLDVSIKLIRDRVGMPNIQMAEANATPDPFMADQYLNINGANKGVILEIRRERRIELYMEDFRWDDIVRWKAGQKITRPLRGLYLPGAGEYDLEGDGDIDIVLYEGDAPDNQVDGIQYLKINSDVFLDADNLIDPHPTFNNRTFDEDKDYLYPIPRVELQLNPNLEQNPGW
ncbi:RagB/SusD family nutrient uptake outer membrane protein [Sinomicrobium weinanense]|uniref:RagB/SusD family nutrient uptake outer membrane protein n=1 Tax=Sinomicrobium weinanense TaxID=2842200 RepID=A0A926JTA0_9FLAO|nr:RagB/SusD family nutrient uptake outer membrane protein [Sinomicrobium weinanense]MBC9796966.1 RagB/SusD family nutrient uptake outer membrane protein [Sinomicrobium weinanense]MBU3124968.1 RagB/SusD family nutrient uptake outer membrane protein [Sinomicrobium weinanense]